MNTENQMLIEELEGYRDRMVSPAETEVLAAKLLIHSQKTNDSYGATIAYYFLALSYYQRGNTTKCLSNASMCNELSNCNNYIDYYIQSCNLMGIMYVAMSEQFLALDYYLKGYYAGKNADNIDTVSRILNNIGDMFHNLGVYEEALLYFKKAKKVREENNLAKDDSYAIIVMNIIECELLLGKEEEAQGAIAEVSALLNQEDSIILKGILLSNEVLFYAKQHNFDKAKELILALLDNVLNHHEYSHTFTSMLRIRNVIYQLRNRKIGDRYIEVLKRIVNAMDDVNFHLRYQEVVIEYYSIMEEKEQWQNAIVEYYYISEHNNKIRKENYSNSLVAKIQLEEILQEQAEILRHSKELKTLSEIDALTQIYNRRAVEARILKKLAAHTSDSVSALVVLDLDYFKQINDNYGHVIGDVVLSTIGSLLKNNFREKNDSIGRLGGDEFIIFIYNIHKDPSIAQKILEERFSSLLEQIRTVHIENLSCKLSASIGICLVEDYSISFTTLYNNADTALYEAKNTGKDRYVFFGKPEIL